MGTKTKKGINTAISLLNVKRCLICAAFSVVMFPVFLLLKLLEPENISMETLSVPVAFFAAFSGAFAYLLYQVAKKRASLYCELVMWMYLAFFQMYLAYIAGLAESLVLYCSAVVVSSLLVYLNTVQYMVLSMVGILGCLWFMIGNGMRLSPTGVLMLAAVYLFMFYISRENYHLRAECLMEEYRLKKERQKEERDPLTGLMNRRGFDRRVGELWEKCVAKQENVGVLMIDIDCFRKYNDRFGYAQGDSCILQVAKKISETVGRAGITARVDGGEFIVFVHGREEKEMQQLAEEVRASVRQLEIPSVDGIITVSIGMDMMSAEEDATLQGLCGRAARQLHLAKTEGRNCVRSTNIRRRFSRIG